MVWVAAAAAAAHHENTQRGKYTEAASSPTKLNTAGRAPNPAEGPPGFLHFLFLLRAVTDVGFRGKIKGCKDEQPCPDMRSLNQREPLSYRRAKSPRSPHPRRPSPLRTPQ